MLMAIEGRQHIVIGNGRTAPPKPIPIPLTLRDLNLGGIPEVVTNGRDAILVKKNDQAALASATAHMLQDRELRERLVSSARVVVARKTPEAYFKSIASIFSHACAQGETE